MLLRRVTAHVRGQDWFAVFLDLMIVVFGVFIGIQVANWNEDRLAFEEEQVYLDRLWVDLNQSIVTLTHERDVIYDIQENAQQTLMALIDNDPDGVSSYDGFELLASTRTNRGSPQIATINELISGGRLNAISDPEIRAGIARLDARLTSRSTLNSIITDYITTVVETIHTHLRPIESEDGALMAAYDFDELAADREFQNALGFAIHMQRNNAYQLDLMLENITEMRDLLSERTGRAIEPLHEADPH